MPDILREAADQYRELMNKTYNIILGKNGKTTNINLTFAPTEFKHVAGLHKLKDIKDADMNSAEFFYQIRKNKITYADITSSDFFTPQLDNRIKLCASLEHYLDDNSTIFEWDRFKSKVKTKIEAKYMIMDTATNINKNIVFIFTTLDNNNPTNNILVSAINDKQDYSEGLSRPYAVLYKSKTDKRTGETTVLFDSGKLDKTAIKAEPDKIPKQTNNKNLNSNHPSKTNNVTISDKPSNETLSPNIQTTEKTSTEHYSGYQFDEIEYTLDEYETPSGLYELERDDIDDMVDKICAKQKADEMLKFNTAVTTDSSPVHQKPIQSATPTPEPVKQTPDIKTNNIIPVTPDKSPVNTTDQAVQKMIDRANNRFESTCTSESSSKPTNLKSHDDDYTP